MLKIENKVETREKINLVSEKDLEISYFVGSGKGGQAKQKCSSGVQIIHKESGAIGRNSESRSQADNKRATFLRMTQTPKFKFWLARRLFELQNSETLEEAVNKDACDANLKYEVRDEDGKWKEVSADYFETTQAKQEIESDYAPN